MMKSSFLYILAPLRLPPLSQPTMSSHRDSIDKSNVLASPTVSVAGATDSGDSAHYIKDLDYTPEEEKAVISILDTRLFPAVLLTTFVLNMDRTNLSNAISDGLPKDLGFTINTVNTAIAIYSVVFSLACFSGAVMSKLVGPSRWIPILMASWGIVTLAHAAIKDTAGFMCVRVFIALTEGGVIPSTLIYLGGFYKGTELTTRLAWFWGIQSIASAVSGLMASGLLQLRGRGGLEGWKWLFLVDGIITMAVSVFIWFYLPRSVAQTSGGLRGFKPWFNERQIQIAFTRVIRDDISKRKYESRPTRNDFLNAAKDLTLWGHFLITVLILTPTNPLGTYLPTVIKSFDFNVFVSNALTAPPYVLQCIISITLIRHAEKVGQRALHGAFGSAWQMVGWIILRAMPHSAPRGAKYFGAVFLASWPYNHPLNIGWMSENSGSIGQRTVSSGGVIFAANIYGTWASQIYQASDAPDFKRGNSANIAVAGAAVISWIAQRQYYLHLNRVRAQKYAELTEAEKTVEDREKEVKGNKSLSFKFVT
ncbi:MFS general substrate transporter [Roridomyces roridus]|uniref:MFS general substrate transporter n=1 Tax=Roridomyces roridus TaxID=1738132 RepID=A0AAD7B830_9AGAR|nr:MFS general substrate transporter [Roridomyces roridus]